MTMDAVDSRREVTALFHDEKSFADAVFGLEAAGFDRAELSALGQEEPLQACLKAADCSMQRLAAADSSPHDAVVLDDDEQQSRVLFTSLAASVAALLASGVALAATGGAAAPAIAAAVAAGGGVGGLTEFLGRRAGQAHSDRLEDQVSRGGIVLWTRVGSSEEESKAMEILRRHGASDVQAHDLKH